MTRITATTKLIFIRDCLMQDRDTLNNHLMSILKFIEELQEYITDTERQYQQKLLQYGEVICRQCVPNVVVEINELKQHNNTKHDACKKVV